MPVRRMLAGGPARRNRVEAGLGDWVTVIYCHYVVICGHLLLGPPEQSGGMIELIG